jgi:hypothetical protein
MKMDKYDLTDKYGAVMMMKALINSIEEEIKARPNVVTTNANKIFLEYIEKDLADIQGEIFKEFTGVINGLSESLKDKESADDV